MRRRYGLGAVRYRRWKPCRYAAATGFIGKVDAVVKCAFFQTGTKIGKRFAAVVERVAAETGDGGIVYRQAAHQLHLHGVRATESVVRVVSTIVTVGGGQGGQHHGKGALVDIHFPLFFHFYISAVGVGDFQRCPFSFVGQFEQAIRQRGNVDTVGQSVTAAVKGEGEVFLTARVAAGLRSQQGLCGNHTFAADHSGIIAAIVQAGTVFNGGRLGIGRCGIWRWCRCGLYFRRTAAAAAASDQAEGDNGGTEGMFHRHK